MSGGSTCNLLASGGHAGCFARTHWHAEQLCQRRARIPPEGHGAGCPPQAWRCAAVQGQLVALAGLRVSQDLVRQQALPEALLCGGIRPVQVGVAQPGSLQVNGGVASPPPPQTTCGSRPQAVRVHELDGCDGRRSDTTPICCCPSTLIMEHTVLQLHSCGPLEPVTKLASAWIRSKHRQSCHVLVYVVRMRKHRTSQV